MYDELTRDELEGMLHDAALNWLAHDGLWFLAVEDRFGMEAAIELDGRAWEQFTVIEAKRIMKRHGIEVAGRISIMIEPNEYNERYLRTKLDKSGHMLDDLFHDEAGTKLEDIHP